MRRVLQLLALTVSLGLLTFLACRAQPRSKAPANAAAPADPATQPVDPPPPAVDAAVEEPPPEVYFPASKAGGVFIPTQQNPQ